MFDQSHLGDGGERAMRAPESGLFRGLPGEVLFGLKKPSLKSLSLQIFFHKFLEQVRQMTLLRSASTLRDNCPARWWKDNDVGLSL